MFDQLWAQNESGKSKLLDETRRALRFKQHIIRTVFADSGKLRLLSSHGICDDAFFQAVHGK
jgi:hypothetical protein